MLPTNSSFNKLKSHYHNDRIRQVNEKLKELTVKENVTLIDSYPHFADQRGDLKAQYTYDGVHLNKQGYDKWKEIFENRKHIK
jgi:lysophospholipase L1-like esterase